MNDKPIWDKIKETVFIPDIYPYPLDSYGKADCYFNPTHPQKSPSFNYHSETETWYCWQCKKGGSIIELYAHLNNIDRRTAIVELAQKYNLYSESISQEEIDKKEKTSEILKDFCDKCYENLKNSKYLEYEKNKRGFTTDNIEFFKIGLFDDTIKNYMDNKYSNEELIDAGLKNNKGNWAMGKRIVYPYLNINNEPIYFIYRLIDSEPDFRKDSKYIKQYVTNYVQNELFGYNSIPLFKNKPLIITEGITDAMSVIQAKYPCISPVTIRFQRQDFHKSVNYCKRFSRVVIIFDNEINKEGLEGAKDTLRFFLKNKINAYIGEIPRPQGKKKIDIDEYLKIGETVSEQEQLLKELIDNSIEGFKYLISFITKDSNQDEIIELLKIIPKGDFVIEAKVIDNLSNKSVLTKPRLTSLLKKTRETETRQEFKDRNEKKESKPEEIDKDRFEKLISSPNSYPLDSTNKSFYLHLDDGFYLLTWNSDIDSGILTKLINANVKIIYKAWDLTHYIFTVIVNGDLYEHLPQENLEHILRNYAVHRDATYGIRAILTTTSLNTIPVKHVLGFSKIDGEGWILPQTELDENGNSKFTITTHTDMQKETLDRARKMIKNYDIKESEEIKKTLKRFVEITDVDKTKLAIILGWCTSAPFISAFKRRFDIFPLLILIGKQITGKSSLLGFFTKSFYKAYDSIYTPEIFKSSSRREDVISMSTFPIFIDEIEALDDYAINMLKVHTTNEGSFVRKRKDQSVMKKPYQASVCMACNDFPKGFDDSAINTKIIVLKFGDKDIINENREWLDLRRKLKREKMFSFVFERTKKWDYYDFEDYIEDLIREYGLNDLKGESLDSRLFNNFIVVSFGIKLWEELFGFNLLDYIEGKNISEKIEKIMKVLTRERITLQKPLWIEFREFCKERLPSNVGENNEEKFALLETPEGNYIFQKKDQEQLNIRLRNNGKQPISTMTKLESLLKDGLQIRYKKFLNLTRKKINGENYYGIEVTPKLLGTEGKQILNTSEIESIEKQFYE